VVTKYTSRENAGKSCKIDGFTNKRIGVSSQKVEDLIEELFGEFEDVFDQETKRVSRLSDGSFVVDSRVGLEELESVCGVRLPKGNYETIGGFVIHRLGRIPTPGEKLVSAGYRIIILRSTPSQIERILIRQRAVGD
jgi:CBS domain containing-hemolysin-like protein